MKRHFIFFIPMILFLFAVQIDAQNQSQVIFPEVPRISAYQAYIKYKSGKAIIIHAGGESYQKRHILGAYNVDGSGVVFGRKQLPHFPMRGVEIIIYCY